MIRPRFTVVQHQITVVTLLVTRRAPGFLAGTIETQQKYPEVKSWSGFEMLIGASPHTLLSSFEPGALPTSVVFPPRMRGWGLTWRADRYSIDLVLARPGGRGLMAYQERDEAWRFAQFSPAGKGV